MYRQIRQNYNHLAILQIRYNHLQEHHYRNQQFHYTRLNPQNVNQNQKLQNVHKPFLKMMEENPINHQLRNPKM